MSQRPPHFYDDRMGPGDAVQDIRFARSADGVGIAYAVHGSGPPLLIDACWLSHLQFDWQSPVWRHYLVELGQIATVIRYDERGHGLSDRGVTDHSLEARVADLEAVADDAGFERFALMAMAQGGPVAIEYAARHPERLTRLIFYGSYAGDQLRRPRRRRSSCLAAFEALIRVGWARPTSEFRRVFSSMMIPGGTEEQMRWLDDLQKMAVDAETAVLARSQRQDGRLHRPDGRARPADPGAAQPRRSDEASSSTAGNWRPASGAPGWWRWRATTTSCSPTSRRGRCSCARSPSSSLRTGRPRRRSAADVDVTSLLSPRELDILRLAAAGRDNDAIAAELVLSVRTVERHLQNAYAKLGLQGRTARTAAVARLLSRA